MNPRRLTLTVTAGRDGQRVDTLLRRVLGLSGTLVKRAKREPDGILLDGVPVFVTQTVRAGQVLSVLVGDTAVESAVVPRPGPLDIQYEDEDLLIINKAPGVAVHPSPDHYDDTLGNFLAEYYRETGQVVQFRPVNRLDRGTSGLMCVAKHAHAQEILKGRLHTGGFRRRYLAICDGVPEPSEGMIDAPIGRAEGSVLKREVRPDGADARTRYWVRQVMGEQALVELELDTGRTHQIRVHMAHLGCPLTGDFLYGVENPAIIGRAALHSWKLTLLHPITGVELAFEAPLPPDMAVLVSEA